MFIKHGSPEPITHIIKSSDNYSAKKNFDELKKESLEEDDSDLTDSKENNVS